MKFKERGEGQLYVNIKQYLLEEKLEYNKKIKCMNRSGIVHCDTKFLLYVNLVTHIQKYAIFLNKW